MNIIPNGWHIEYDPKPIPISSHDYNYYHDDYDGADGGNGLAGTASSVDDAMNQIMEIQEDG